mgnify:CR=1 FL=1
MDQRNRCEANLWPDWPQSRLSGPGSGIIEIPYLVLNKDFSEVRDI